MILAAGAVGLNHWIWVPAKEFGIDPLRIAQDWTPLDCVEAFRAIAWLSDLDYARAPAPKEK